MFNAFVFQTFVCSVPAAGGAGARGGGFDFNDFGFGPVAVQADSGSQVGTKRIGSIIETEPTVFGQSPRHGEPQVFEYFPIKY